MVNLLEDIKVSALWIVDVFATENILLDYSIESFRELDRFFDEETIDGKVKLNGRLSQNTGGIMFSIAAYVGETIIKHKPGALWETNDEDPEGEVNISIILPEGIKIFPAQRIIKRLKNGIEDSIYAYGAVMAGDNVLGDKKTIDLSSAQTRPQKPWWKIL